MPFLHFYHGSLRCFFENAGCQLRLVPTSVIMLIPYILILTLNK